MVFAIVSEDLKVVTIVFWCMIAASMTKNSSPYLVKFDVFLVITG